MSSAPMVRLGEVSRPTSGRSSRATCLHASGHLFGVDHGRGQALDGHVRGAAHCGSYSLHDIIEAAQHGLAHRRLEGADGAFHFDVLAG